METVTGVIERNSTVGPPHVNGSVPASKSVRMESEQAKSEQAKAELARPEQAKKESDGGARKLTGAAERLNKALRVFNRDLAISVDHNTGKMVVQVTEPSTGKVIRQIPPEQVLDAEVNIDKIIGLLINDQF